MTGICDRRVYPYGETGRQVDVDGDIWKNRQRRGEARERRENKEEKVV